MPTATTAQRYRSTRPGLGIACACTVVMILSARVSSAQHATPAPAGFEMAVPEGWHPMTRQDVVDNVKQVRLSPEKLQALLADFSRAVVVAAYLKYQPDQHDGLNPKVQVDLIRHTARTFDRFRATIVGSTEALKRQLNDFTLTEPPQTTQVGGRQAVLIKATFRLGDATVGTLVVRTRMYAVPIGETFYQIAFSDSAEEDCTAVFDELVRTIRFQ